MIHVSPTTEVIRVYHNEANYENRDAYDGCCQLTYIPPIAAVITGMHGRFCRTDIRDIFRHVHSRGTRYVVAERAPGHNLPWGKRIDRGGPMDGWYEIDLDIELL